MAGPTHLFTDTITVADVTGRDAYGKPSFGPQAQHKARVQPKRKVIRDAQGAEHLASHVIFTAAPVTLKSRLWLPGDDPAVAALARRPAAVDDFKNGRGQTVFRTVWI